MTEILAWTQEAWKDYVYWQGQDRKTLKRINKLVLDTQRNPFEGIGKPEPLKENLSGFWSRRIDEGNRLVYIVDNNHLTIISCRYHYEKWLNNTFHRPTFITLNSVTHPFIRQRTWNYLASIFLISPTISIKMPLPIPPPAICPMKTWHWPQNFAGPMTG